MLRAMKDNFDLRALDLQIQVAGEFVTVAKSDYYPTLALYGNWTNQGQSDNLNSFLSATSSGVGLNLSMNLFNGLRSDARVQQAKADEQILRSTMQQARDGVRLQVRAILNNLASARHGPAAYRRPSAARFRDRPGALSRRHGESARDQRRRPGSFTCPHQ